MRKTRLDRSDPLNRDFRNKQSALLEEIKLVLEAAGIVSDLKHLDDDLMPYALKYGFMPESSLALRRASVSGTRKIIFGVKDENLRKKLIAYWRQYDLLQIEQFKDILWMEQHELDDLREKQRLISALLMAIPAALFVGLAATFFGLAVGLGTLAFFLILTLHDLKRREEAQRSAIRKKAAKVTETNATIIELVERQFFTQQEEYSGVPDEPENRWYQGHHA